MTPEHATRIVNLPRPTRCPACRRAYEPSPLRRGWQGSRKIAELALVAFALIILQDDVINSFRPFFRVLIADADVITVDSLLINRSSQ